MAERLCRNCSWIFEDTNFTECPDCGVAFTRDSKPESATEKRGKLYRIVYSHGQGKPTFIHFRADSESAAVIAFFGELMPPLVQMMKIQIASVAVDNEYTGPIIGEDFELPKEGS